MTTGYKRVIRASNDILFNEDGSTHIDMFGANGTVLLGHCHPEIGAHLHRQLDAAWNTGVLETPVRARAKELIQGYFPDTHGVAAIYSTGMESAEFAIRLCRVSTGRKDLIGFDKSMHGKSMATAFLAWENPHGYALPGVKRLPFPQPDTEADILEQLEQALAGRTVAAVFLEPIQGSGGGYYGSPGFYHRVRELCTATGTLLLFDEILVGFYRTGTAFYHSKLGFTPDVVLIGKIMGNGFPVSAVVARKELVPQPAMLPGSTYAGNPLASAAIVGTLEVMAGMDMEEATGRIGRAVQGRLAGLSGDGFSLRGEGALWVFHFADPAQAQATALGAYGRGVFVSQAGPLVRLLPAATIAPENLATALDVVADEVERHTGRALKAGAVA